MSAASDLLDRAPRSTVRAVERVLQAGKNTTQEALITRMLNALADAVPHMSPHAAGDAVGEASGYNVLLRILEQPWWRFHQCRFGAVHFGRSGNSRFDPPQGPQGAYSVLYAATDVHGAFMEIARNTPALVGGDG